MSNVKIKVLLGIIQCSEGVQCSEDVQCSEGVQCLEVSSARRMSRFGGFSWSECALGFQRMSKGF